MNGLLTQSNLSFESSESQRPPSILSLATSTSASTVGIGALSGRMIFAVGEVAARGLENLAIRRRLGKVISAFPHQNYVAKTDIGTIYDDTLEFSRFGRYRAQIQLQALRVLLVQIATRQTHYLLRGLLKWPPIEIALFISEILACMPADWLPPGTDNHANLTDAYFSSQKSNESHPASPLVDFVITVAKVDQATCQAVLLSGFLDVLLCMYACNFTSSPHSVGDIRGDRNTLSETVCAALVELCCDHDALDIVSVHPICGLWPMDQSSRIRLGGQIHKRQRLWRQVEQQLGRDIIMRRISSLARMLGIIEVLDLAELTDARIDVVEFSRDHLYGSQIAEKARALMSERVAADMAQSPAVPQAPEQPSGNVTEPAPRPANSFELSLVDGEHPQYTLADDVSGIAITVEKLVLLEDGKPLDTSRDRIRSLENGAHHLPSGGQPVRHLVGMSTILAERLAMSTFLGSGDVKDQLKRGGDRIIVKNEMKMLLLGTGESGKSTILKQMVLIYNGPYTNQDRQTYKEIIFFIMARSMQAILREMPMLDLSLSPQNNARSSFILSISESDFPHQREPFDAIRDLWGDPSVKEAARQSHLFQLNDSAAYYFDSTERVSSPGYLPTDEDILRSSLMTTGIFETTIKMGELTYKIFDTGGQRSERKKWIHCFENVTTLLYVVSLSEYNQKLYEDEHENRMQDSLMVFESLCQSRWFAGTSIVLLLNKIDLFAEKICRSPLSDYFPDYLAGPNFDAACDYLRDKFLSKAKTKQVYTHYICATDTQHTKSVLSTIQDQLLRLHLRDVRYLA